MNNHLRVMDLVLKVGRQKYETSWGKLLVLGLLAGVYIAMGGLLSSFAASAAEIEGGGNPLLIRLVAAGLFPLGLMLVLLVGAELFTGNTATLMPAVMRGDVPTSYLFKNWAVVFLANVAGAILFDYLIVYQGQMLAQPAQLDYIMRVARLKTELPWHVVFVRGIGANWLVCLAVWMSLASRNMVGRMLGIWWPVMAFVMVGFEHSIANVFFIPTGIFYGADVTWTAFVFGNLLPSTLGNVVGGCGFVGCLYAYLYMEKKGSSLKA